LHSIYYYL